MRLLVLASFLVLGCSRPAPLAERVEAGAVTPSVPVAIVDAGPQRTTKTGAYAHFVEDTLTECVDMRVTDVTRLDEAGVEIDQIGAAGKTLPTGSQRIAQSCTQAFGDRPVLASCTLTDQSDKGSSELVFSYYTFAKVGLNDAEMKECLGVKGAWKAMPRDSREWRRAKLDYDTKALHKQLGKLNAAAPEE